MPQRDTFCARIEGTNTEPRQVDDVSIVQSGERKDLKVESSNPGYNLKHADTGGEHPGRDCGNRNPLCFSSCALTPNAAITAVSKVTYTILALNASKSGPSESRSADFKLVACCGRTGVDRYSWVESTDRGQETVFDGV